MISTQDRIGVLSCPTRRKMVQFLYLYHRESFGGILPASVIAKTLKITPQLCSYHLQALLNHKMVTREQIGKNVCYTLDLSAFVLNPTDRSLCINIMEPQT